MAFLSGSIGVERFRVVGSKLRKFSGDQLELLSHFASGKFKTSSEENVQVGFLGAVSYTHLTLPTTPYV